MKTRLSLFVVLLSVLVLAACQAGVAPATESRADVIREAYVCPVDYSRIEEKFYLTEDVPDEEIQALGDAYCKMDLTSTLAKERLVDVQVLIKAQRAYLRTYSRVTDHTSQYDGIWLADPEILTLWLSGQELAQIAPESYTLVWSDKECDSGVTNPCNLYRHYKYEASDGSYLYTASLEDEDGEIFGVWVWQRFGIYGIARDCDASIMQRPAMDIFECPITYTTLYLDGGREVNLSENGMVFADYIAK